MLTGQFRQSVFGRLGGYEDVNDADRHPIYKEDVMKEVKYFVLALTLSVVVIGCAPDLIVKNVNVNWDASNKKSNR